MAIHGIMRGGTVDPLVGASLTVTGTSALGGQVDFTGVQTDTSVGTQDDFALQSGVTVLRANPASTVTYDGFAGGVAGRVLFIINMSANLVNLSNEAAGSTAANRILGQVGSNCTLNGAAANANSNALLIYDGVSSRWRVIATNTNVFNSGMSFSAATTFNSSVRTNSVLTPAAASGSTNDVAGGSTANVIRQDVSSAAVFTGLVAQTAGQTVTLINIATAAANTLTLSHESASSTAANRFTFLNGTPLVLGPGASVTLRYDGTSSRWRPISQTATSPMGSGSPDGALTGAAGQQYVDTTTGVTWQNTDGATAWDPVIIPPRAGWTYFSDLVENGLASASAIGAGAASNLAEIANPGIKHVTASAAGVDGATVGSGGGNLNAVTFSGGVYRTRCAVRIPTLSDGTNNIIIRAGAHDATTVADAVDGVYLEYDFATHANHNWWVCSANNSTRTKTDTGILAVASSTTFQSLGVKVNAAGTSLVGYVNGVAGATPVTTNIPAAAGRGLTNALVLGYKQLGAGALTFDVDWLDSYMVLTTMRSA